MGCKQSTHWDDSYFQHLPPDERNTEFKKVGARFSADEHLGKLSPYALNKMLCFKKAAKLVKNEEIVVYGKIPTHLYYVYSSNQYGYVSQKSARKKMDKEKRNVEDVIFDSDDFLLQRKSLRSVKVMKNSFVFRVAYTDYHKIMSDIKEKVESPLFAFISELNFMAGSSEGDKLDFYDMLEISHYKHNDAIIKVGDDGDYVYWIFEGQVRIYPKDDPTPLLLKAPSHFGELALLSREKRNASIYSDGPSTTLIKLREKYFRKLSQTAIDIFLNIRLDRHFHKKQEEKLIMLSTGGDDLEEINIFDAESMQKNKRNSLNFKERVSLSQNLHKKISRLPFVENQPDTGKSTDEKDVAKTTGRKVPVLSLLTCSIEKSLSCNPEIVLNNFRFRKSTSIQNL